MCMYKNNPSRIQQYVIYVLRLMLIVDKLNQLDDNNVDVRMVMSR